MRLRSFRALLLPAALLALGAAVSTPCQSAASADFDAQTFKAPPAQYRGQAMGSINLTTSTPQSMIDEVQQMKELNYGGFFLEAGGSTTQGLSPEYLKRFGRGRRSDKGIEFLSPEYFKLYDVAMQEAQKDGLKVVLYDDYSFPTGTAGGLLYSQFPQYVAKSLDMVEQDVTGPAKADLAIPQGIYMGAVLMNLDTHQLMDVSEHGKAGHLTAAVPKGRWKAMAFYLAEGQAQVVDYLDPKAMTAFMSLTYDRYGQYLGKYFGNLITQTFYDEPSMHHADRMWTPDFNAAFEKRYGYSPMKYYPALWYDIGPETDAARDALYGFRATLYEENFVKRLDDWCREHNLQFGGHTDQEEPANPTPLTGDLIKMFKYQTIPTVDDIWWYGRSNVSYKIVTSAGFNYDHRIIRAETYAAYHGLTDKIAFKVAMDQYAMGINSQVPARTVQPKRPELNEYVGRLSYMLQGGRHVADVAVLYPIDSLHADYHNAGGVQFPLAGGEKAPQIMEEAYSREGGPAPDDDYQNVGEDLFRASRVDYTYLHPEVLVDNCTVEHGTLVLNNKVNREVYKVLILPAGDVLSAAAAKKIKEFYDGGGTVIATEGLPTHSAEFGKDREVQQDIADIFGVSKDEPLKADVKRIQDRANLYVFWYYVKKNAAGGQAFYLPNTHPWLLDSILKLAVPVRDVTFDQLLGELREGPEYDGALTYIHKVKDGRDVYFFANSSPKDVDTTVVLRGAKKLSIWDPQTGATEPAEVTTGEVDGQPTTTVHLKLPSVYSLLYVGGQASPGSGGRIN
ncbi:MAG TPA: glycosyl hydrolase [Acidobacteriaceae bacterium]|nr:glycosyl hydrolase [Acidobacteriaceae bacterium]